MVAEYLKWVFSICSSFLLVVLWGVMQPHTSIQEEDCGAVGMDIGGKVLTLSSDFNIWIG